LGITEVESAAMNPIVERATLGIYAVLLALGGVMGFVRARSKASLIAGLVSAAATLVALGLSTVASPLGRPLGALLAMVLFVFFGYRYAIRNRRFMPSGLMAVVSFVVLAIMIVLMVVNVEQT
jgi:uncharacterized membrane protein (UPF0136 family)